MAAPTWNTNLTTFWLTGATTVTALGGGAAGLSNPETDYYIEGTDCLSKQAWTNATKGFIVDALGANFTVPTDGAVILFAKFDAQGSLATKTNGGFQVIIGSANNAYNHYYIGGSDTLAFDSWVPYVIDPNTATADATTGSPSGSERWVGILANLPTTAGPTKGNPIAIDAVRYGRCTVEYTNGDLGNGYNTFSGAEAFANATTRRWGLIQLEGGAYVIQGFHSFGTSGTAVDFRDSNKVLFWRPAGNNNLSNNAVSAAFNRMEILNASTNVDWDNIIVQSLGTRARGVFVHTAGTFDATNCQFIDMDTFSFLSTTVATDCIFRRTNAITAPGSTLNGTQVLTPTVAADASAVIWNVATDPDGFLDDMTFSKGTNAHHAIQFGTSAPTSINLRGWTTTGFSASDGNNDSTLYFADKGSDTTWTVNVIDGSGNFTFKKARAGDTVNIVIDPVTVSVTVRDASTNGLISGARVLVEVADGTNFPYQDSVTISGSGTTATVTHTGHGLTTNDNVVIRGANQTEYNGAYTITVTGTNTYTYTTPVTVTTGTPTGTITSTFAIINGTTSGTGVLTDTRTYSTSQAVIGRVRKSTSSPLYIQGTLSETVSNTTGLTVTVQLVRDE